MKPSRVFSGFAIGGLLWTTGLTAAEWDTGAGITVGGYYTDNVCLANRNPEGEWVGTVRPDVSLQGRGARANLALRASAEYNSRAESDVDCSDSRGQQLTDRESVIPRVRFTGEVELLEDSLFLESRANAHRSTLDPFAPGGEDNLNGRDNTNIIWNYAVGARLQRRLANAADLFLRYTYDEQFNSTNLLGDSSEDRAEFSLARRAGASRLSYGVAGRYSRVEYASSPFAPSFVNELASAEFNVGLALSDSWQLNGLVGEEWNEYTSVLDDIDGSFWDAGVRWTPNPRVQVDLGYGERFFGDAPRAAVRYQHKRVELTASYTRTLSLPRNLRAVTQFEDPDDIFGPDPDGLPGDPLAPGGQPTFLGDGPLLNERFTVGWRFNARRTNFSLTGSDSRQERTDDGAEATFSALTFTATRDLGRSLSATGRLGWNQREGRGESVSAFGEESRGWRGGLGLTRGLGRHTSVSLAYEYVTRESDFELNDYDESRVILTLRHEFL